MLHHYYVPLFQVKSTVKMVLERQIDQACDPKEPNSKSLNFLNHVQEQVSLPVYISRVLCNYNI